MKVLSFVGEAAEDRFDVVYGGLLTTTRSFERKELRVIDRILEKLEAIGKPMTAVGVVGFELATPSDVELEDAEFALLNESLTACRWTAAGARKSTRVLTWLDEVAKGDGTK